MPLSSVDYRSTCGQFDLSKNKKTTYNATQTKLNNIAKRQQYKTPEQCGALSLLYLSSFILPNIMLINQSVLEPKRSPTIDSLSIPSLADSVISTRQPTSIDSLAPHIRPVSLLSESFSQRILGFGFPMAQGATLPQLDVIQRNDENGILIAAGDDGKRLLLNLAKSFLINMGSISLSRIKDIEFRWSQASAGEPITLAHVEFEQTFQREKRISIKERNKIIGDHIRDNCAFEAEIYNPDGSKAGELLIFKAQRIDNPFRMLYDNIPGYEPSKTIHYTSKVSNYILDILTLGFKPLFSNLWANYYRQQYYALLNDEICERRQMHINFANVATALDVSGLKFAAAKRIPIIKPIELKNIIPFKDGSAFVLRNKGNNIEKSVWLTAKPQKTSGREETVVLTPKGEKEFESTSQAHSSQPKEKKRVVFDETEKIWSFADQDPSSPLDLQIESGNNFVTLYGERYRLKVDSNFEYEIVALDIDGIEHHFPVYQNPLSATWHLQHINGHPSYTRTEQQLIANLNIDPSPQLRYDAITAQNPEVNLDAVLFEVRNRHDEVATSSPLYQVVEMNGAIVPVRTAVMHGHGVHYSVYDIKTPLKSGYRIEWNGERWRMELWTSPHVSKSLNELISPQMFSTDVPMKSLSSADTRGIQWADHRGFIRVRGHYVEIRPGNIFRIGPEGGKQFAIHYRDAQFFPLTPKELRERSRSISSQELVSQLKELSQDQFKNMPQFLEVERAVRRLAVKSSLSEAKNVVVSDTVNATITGFKRPNHPVPVEVESVPSSTVDKKRFLVTIGKDDYFFVEISRDGKDIRVLLDDEETLAMEKHRNALSGGGIQLVAALRRDEETPTIRAGTRAEIDATARERIEYGTTILGEVLDKMSGNNKHEKSLIVANANFFKTAEFENNVFTSPDSAYEAMIDILIPLSRQYPRAIIIPGSIYVSQDIPQNLLYGALRYQLGNNTRNVENMVNLSTIMVPVLYNGRFVAIARKGEFLSYQKKNAPPERSPLPLRNMDEIPWGSTLFANGAKNNPHTDFGELDGARVGTLFVGKTLFPGERAKADWFFCPCPETNGTRNVENFFSNEFIIEDEKFLLVIEDEFIQYGDERPEVRKHAYPQEEDVNDANRYDWVIHCTAGHSLDEKMQSAGYNYLEANTRDGAEYASMINQRLHLVSYSAGKKLTLYEFLKN